MNKLVFDIETQNTFQDTGSKNPESLSMSVIAIYDYEKNKYLAFSENELDQLWPYIDSADTLIGFNSNHFDIPILNKYYKYDLKKKKSIDILEMVKNSLGRRLKLDWIAKGTLGYCKSGHGLEAIEWWKNGEIDKIKKYCIDDVKITKEIFEYVIKNNSLKYEDFGNVNEIKIDTTLYLDPTNEDEINNTSLNFL